MSNDKANNGKGNAQVQTTTTTTARVKRGKAGIVSGQAKALNSLPALTMPLTASIKKHFDSLLTCKQLQGVDFSGFTSLGHKFNSKAGSLDIAIFQAVEQYRKLKKIDVMMLIKAIAKHQGYYGRVDTRSAMAQRIIDHCGKRKKTYFTHAYRSHKQAQLHGKVARQVIETDLVQVANYLCAFMVPILRKPQPATLAALAKLGIE